MITDGNRHHNAFNTDVAFTDSERDSRIEGTEMMPTISYYENTRNHLVIYERFSTVLGPVGFILNGLTFIVLWCMKRKQKQAVILVMMALCVADPVATIVNIDYVIFSKFGYSLQQNTRAGCKLIPYFAVAAKDCSNVFCLLIAIERFISVYFPLKVALICTRRRILIAASASTFIILGLESYCLVAYTQKNYLKIWNVCVTEGQYVDLRFKLNFVISQIFGFLMPWLLIGVLNFLIVVKVNISLLQRKKLGVTDNHHSQSITFMFLGISLFSLGTNILNIYNLVYYIATGINVHIELAVISSILVLCNHTFNFVFYALAGKNFRKTLVSLVTCGKCYEEGKSFYKIMSS